MTKKKLIFETQSVYSRIFLQEKGGRFVKYTEKGSKMGDFRSESLKFKGGNL